MAKVSRPIVYMVVLGVVAYAVVLLTEPEQAARKASTARPKTTATLPTGFTEEDYKASFPRYTVQGRSAFQPKVVSSKKQLQTASEGLRETWKLTGVSKMDNVLQALIESNSGEIAFLKVGDKWNDLRVVSIEPDAIRLVSSEGVPTRLVFSSVEEEKPEVITNAPVLLPSPAPAPAAAPVIPDPQADRNARRAERRAARQGGGE